MNKYIYALAALSLLFACTGKEEEAPVVKVQSIAIEQSDMTLTEGESVNLSAKVLPENAADKTVNWSSSDESVVMVSSNGKAMALSLGKAIITAKSGDKSDFISITVEAKVIPVTGVSLDKTQITIKVGESETLTPTITPEDATNKKVSWTSSNDKVATVEEGKVVGVLPGSVTITVTTEDGSKTAECPVTVKSNLAPSVTVGADHISAVSAVLSGKINEGNLGATFLFGFQYYKLSGTEAPSVTTLIATNADEEKNYTATITGLEPSTTYSYWSFIRQIGHDTYGETKEFTTKDVASLLETRDASGVEATKATLNAKLDLTDVQYTNLAYGFFFGLSESGLNTDIKCSEIKDNAISAPLTGLSHKTQYWYKAYVKLDSQTFYGEVKTFTTDVVPVGNVSLDKTEYTFHTIGNTLTLKATVLPADATDKSVSWTSDKEAVATVDANGRVTAKGNGVASITVTAKDQGKTATCVITVAQWVTGIGLDKTSITLNEGQEQTLIPTVNPSNAADKSLNWTSSNPSVATVNAEGKVTAVSKGTATIKAEAKDGSGKYASCSVTVKRPVSSIQLNKSSLVLYRGTSNVSETLTATVIPSDANNTAVTWTSSNTSVATVSSSGVVTGKSKGTATITVTANDGNGAQATCAVEVKQYVTSISLDNTSLLLEVGNVVTLSVKSVLPDNANDKTYTWSSSDSAIASVDNSGKVTAKAKGKATIKATANDGSGVFASCSSEVCRIDVPEAVDMGTVVNGKNIKWASFNVGASSPEEYGLYYAWGETGTKSDYSWSTYKWCNGSGKTLTKYNTNSSYGNVDNKTVLESSDDVASVKLGGKWRMPTYAEWTELRTKCTWKWTTNYNGTGVEGQIVTATNGNSIFLPCAGSRGSSLAGEGDHQGLYWSSSLYTADTNYPYYAWFVYFYYDRFYSPYLSYLDLCRYNGASVRPVIE